MTTATATAETEQDLVIAGLIQQVRGEAELRTRQAEAQQMRQALADELKAVTTKINQQIQECNAIDQDSGGSFSRSAGPKPSCFDQHRKGSRSLHWKPNCKS